MLYHVHLSVAALKPFYKLYSSEYFPEWQKSANTGQLMFLYLRRAEQL